MRSQSAGYHGYQFPPDIISHAARGAAGMGFPGLERRGQLARRWR